jgi:Fe-S-cluster-containing dehydrogenase component
MTTEEKIQKRLEKPLPVPGTDEQVTELVIIHDPDKCTGCGQCMIGCAYKHYKTFDRRWGLLYVNESPDRKGFYVNANCQHCVYPMCLASCPKDAIYKNEKGIVMIAPMLCVGCGTCNQACPIAVPRLDEERMVFVKCDFCDGDYPACVQMCSTNALSLLPRKEAFELVKKLRGV